MARLRATKSRKADPKIYSWCPNVPLNFKVMKVDH